MGMDVFQIVFDNSLSSYYSTQTMSGSVNLSLNSPKKIRGILLRFSGECKVHWRKVVKKTSMGKTTRRTVHFTGQENYFEHKFNLIGETNGTDTITLEAGVYKYPFSLVIPENIPSSYEHRDGYIRYTVRAKIDRPWKFDQETKSAFTVISPLDLNIHPSAKNPLRVVQDKYYGILCCKSGPLTVVASLPVGGYVPGQEIPITLEVDNTSDQQVNLSACLCKVATFYSTFPHKETKQDKVKLLKVELGLVEARRSRTFVEQLAVPALPPSNLVNCRHIDLDYVLVIEGKATACCHKNFKLKMPVVIGSIPLTSYQLPIPAMKFSAGDGETSTSYLPTAPMLEDSKESPPNPSTTEVVHKSLYPDLPPPSYREAVLGGQNIRDPEDSEHMLGNVDFTPRYPMYNFQPNAPSY